MQDDAPARQVWPAGLFPGLDASSSTVAHSSGAGGGGTASLGSGSSSMAWEPGGGGAAAAVPGSPLRRPAAPIGAAAAAAAAGSPGGAAWFSPTRSRIRYSDRFIPSRAASVRLDLNGALDREAVVDQVPGSVPREDVNPAYSQLLRSELLGVTAPVAMSPERGGGHLDGLLRSGAAAAGAGGGGGGSFSALGGGGSLSSGAGLSGGRILGGGGGDSPAKKILRFRSGGDTAAGSPSGSGVQPPGSPFLSSPVGVEALLGSPIMSPPRRPPRKIPRAPYKVLDAPALADDFYLNLVDWSAQNLLAVGLDAAVYLWNAGNSKVTKLCDLPAGDSVCSVAWSQRGTYLSVGTHSGEVQIWDVTKLRCTRTMGGHRQRVGTQAWASATLASGSRDKSVLLRDVRVPAHYSGRLTGHKSEVCGLKWSPDDRQLASGGNDNALLVWRPADCSTAPALRFTEHVAAVKAIAWSPHAHGLLASGGGTADRCIRFWNTSGAGGMLQCVDTGSQVCNLAWCRHANELVSAHGYSHNQVVVWRYPGMARLATLTGHTYRVLYLATSPDGQTIVTGAGDETLRFWSVFQPPASGTSGAGTPGRPGASGLFGGGGGGGGLHTMIR